MKTELKIEGMVCEHCRESITNVLLDLEGVTSVIIMLEDGTAEVTHDESISHADLIKAIKEGGFSVPPTA